MRSTSGVNCWNSLPREQAGSPRLFRVCLQSDVLFVLEDILNYLTRKNTVSG